MKDSEEQTLQEEEIMADEKKPNVQQELYSIGEVSRICNVSKKALRFYDKINIIADFFRNLQIAPAETANSARAMADDLSKAVIRLVEDAL